MKQAVFIGSFNPITNGHLIMAQELLNCLDIDRVLFIPVSDHYKKEELLPQEIRVHLLQLATKDHPDLVVSQVEFEFAQQFNRQAKTIETLNLLQETSYLVIGSDNLKDLENWYQADRLVENYPVIIYPRDSYSVSLDGEFYQKHKEQFIFLENVVTSNISATKVRLNYKLKKSNIHLVDKKVDEYILKNHLYGA